VADSYDAMTSDRPYRAAMDHQTAIEELEKSSGRQFDPAVVEAFLAVVDNVRVDLRPSTE
jgi:HD-GYP domain-containing protein (c-di-GMP phosphodiesterase class II)